MQNIMRAKLDTSKEESLAERSKIQGKGKKFSSNKKQLEYNKMSSIEDSPPIPMIIWNNTTTPPKAPVAISIIQVH